MTDKQSVLFIHIDGFGYNALLETIDNGYMPFLNKLVLKGSYLYKASCSLPSNTLNFFARLFYGPDILIPGSRWLDKKTGKISDITDIGSLRRLERELEKKYELLFKDATLFASLLGKKGDTLGLIRSNHSFKNIAKSIAILAPAALAKTYKLGSLKKFYLGIMESATKKGVHAIINSMKKKTSQFLYINLMAYDQSCHKMGLHHKKTILSLKTIDTLVKKLLDACNRYNVTPIVFSDHGMAPSISLKNGWGISLKELLHSYLHHRERFKVLSSGNLAHVYFQAEKNMDEYENSMLEFSTHRGIGLVLSRQNDGEVLFFTNGSRTTPERCGIDDPHLRNELVTLAIHPLSGDFVVFGAEIEGDAVNFMNQKACHNGFILGQREPFLISPLELEDGNEHDIVKALRDIFNRLAT